MKITLYMKGLDCANCAEKIRAESVKIPFVKTAEMNFMAKKLNLEIAEESDEAVIRQVRKITAELEPDVEVIPAATETSDVQDEDSSDLKRELIKIIAAVIIFAVGLALRDNSFVMWIFLSAYFIAGLDVLVTAGKNIIKGRPFDECFLMTAATIGAFCIGEYHEGVAVMILYQLGELLQSVAVRRSRKSIASLMDIRPDSASVKRGETVEQLAPELVQVGEIIVIRAGEKIPLDSVIVSGRTTVDTSALTGESVPREAAEGDSLTSGCVNLTGLVEARVEREYGESTVTKILELVENASSKKARSEQFITRFARWYTPCVVIAAVLLAVVPVLINGFASQYVYNALSFLVVSCPCALVISVPLSFFGGIGGASARGILIKGGTVMEQLADCGTVVFDKTGTLTDGSFEVTRIVPENGTEQQLVSLAAIAEQASSHPAAAAVMKSYGGTPDKAEITEIAGKGVCAISCGREILAGNRLLLEERGVKNIPEEKSAGTLVYIAENGLYKGFIEISDSVKADSEAAVAELKNAGIKTVMLTGDRSSSAEITAKKLGLDQWYAELLPDGKVEMLEQLMGACPERKKTIFVGDGINDAPVLMRADAGVAMGGVGSDAAIEAADVVIMNDEPSKLIEAIKISRKTRGIVTQNIVFSLAVKAAVLVLSALGLATMWAAVFADVGVCLIAVANAMRARKI